MMLWNRNGIANSIKQPPSLWIRFEMHGLTAHNVELGWASDCDQVIAVMQPAGGELLIAKHFGVAHFSWQI